VTGDTGRNCFLLNRGRGGETVAGDALLQIGVQSGENRTGCWLGLSLRHDCVGRSFSDAVVIGFAGVFGVVSNVFCVVLVICHGAFFCIVGSGSAVMILAGSGSLFGGVSGGFVMPGFGFGVRINDNCSFCGVFVILRSG